MRLTQNKNNFQSNFLGIDVGGTKVFIALYQDPIKDAAPTHTWHYPTHLFKNFFELWEKFLFEAQLNFKEISPHLSLAIAGPVSKQEHSCYLTNIDWLFQEDELKKKFPHFEFHLLNDLEAQGYAVAYADSVLEKVWLSPERQTISTQENKAILACGTGLGECFILSKDSQHHIIASEGGHSDFSPTDNEQRNFLNYISKKFSHVSWERVASSGLGLPLIYDFLTNELHMNSITITENNFSHDLISAYHQKHPTAQKTVHVILDMLMSEASNMALKFLTQGGVYLSGGFLSSNKDILLDNRIKLFEKFIDKGRFKNILENIPLILLTQNDIGARGSAIYSTRFQS